jgi:hypothetical protein
MNPAEVAAAMKQKVPDDWGSSKKNAIEVCLPSGEHYFLRDLRCPDGKAPRYRRLGSVGSRTPMPDGMDFKPGLMDPTIPVKRGEADYHVIDKYEVTCTKATYILFLDMYHCPGPKPWAAPRGFTRPPHG